MPNGQFDGYIFDYGGVLVFNQTAEDIARMCQLSGIPADRFPDVYWERRHEYDDARLSAHQYWSAMAAAAECTVDDEQIQALIEADCESWMHYDEAMWDWIVELRARGKRIAMLSNMPRELGEVLRRKTRRLRSFDHVTLSYELGCGKPARAIYEHCLAGIGTEPGRTLFLDDRIVNVEGAAQIGIRARQFTTRLELFSEVSLG